MIQHAIERLAVRLDARADPEVRAGADAYLKHVIPHRGVKRPGVTAVVRQWLAEDLHEAEPSQLREIGFALLRQPYSEDKYAGAMVLERVIAAGALGWREELDLLTDVFDDGCVQEWATCDTVCGRVCAPLITQGGMECARAVASWRDASNVWRRRAAAVSFVGFARKGESSLPGLTALVLQTAGALLPSPERFINLGVGWVLRELGNNEPDAVLAFVESRLADFNAEGLRYALEKRDPALRKELSAKRTALTRRRRST